jgi:hemerythrin superfamily protein
MSSKHNPRQPAQDQNTLDQDALDQDAIELLMADHRRVARLFAEFHALKEEGSNEAKSSLVARICQELTVHTAIEEEIFYPAVRREIEDDALMDEALVEHAGAKQLIAQLLAADPDDDLYDAQVTVLGEQIDHHVEEEEGSMFPQAKGSGVDTLLLGAELLKRKAELLAHPATTPPKAAGDIEADMVGEGHDDAEGHDVDAGDEEGGAPKSAAPPAKSGTRAVARKKSAKQHGPNRKARNKTGT